MRIRKLSIIVPAYNEEKTIEPAINHLLSVQFGGIKKEIIVVDDGSKDKTFKMARKIKDKRIKLIHKKINKGKGAAIQSALKYVTGDIIVIQDADLEYNPKELIKLIKPIQENLADVVYGSRFVSGEGHRVLLFWHMIGNKFLTLTSNMITNINLTDMETCYKMFTKEIARKLNLQEKRFGFEPEFTVKVAKIPARVYEVGISYSGRNYTEGKKIGWKDGIWAFWCMIKYGIFE